MSKLVRLVGIGLLVLGLAACGGDDDDDGGDAAENPEDTGGDTTAVTVSGSAFDPSAIEVAAGDVTFDVTNEDAFAHTFTVDDADVRIELPASASATGRGTFESGTDYSFRCEIHPSMTGTITVM